MQSTDRWSVRISSPSFMTAPPDLHVQARQTGHQASGRLGLLGLPATATATFQAGDQPAAVPQGRSESEVSDARVSSNAGTGQRSGPGEAGQFLQYPARSIITRGMRQARKFRRVSSNRSASSSCGVCALRSKRAKTGCRFSGVRGSQVSSGATKWSCRPMQIRSGD